MCRKGTIPLMFRRVITVATSGEGDIINLTPHVRSILSESGVKDGMCHLFVTGSTAAITTIEYEPGVLSDLKKALSVLAPDDISYAHDQAWGDGNGRSHVKAAVVGPSLTVPVIDGDTGCGTWQQIVLLELDTRSSRTRTVCCTVTESAASG